ncbi:MAG: NDP-hexose 4-ketoreductase, partial [Micrococcales bacterium]|nr:NDP-hexose 4-ketoreductase [Micrococcales bacterium]
MFERFTAGARQVVVGAQDEARRLKHDHIGPEHLLGSLLRDSTAAQVLASIGISVDTVRAQVEQRTGTGQHAAAGDLAWSAGAKKALELAGSEAPGKAPITS